MEYCVKFIGYMGLIVAKNETIHASLDFVSGRTFLECRGSHVSVSKRCELAPFIATVACRLTCTS
jgi:hypothetical protein